MFCKLCCQEEDEEEVREKDTGNDLQSFDETRMINLQKLEVTSGGFQLQPSAILNTSSEEDSNDLSLRTARLQTESLKLKF